MLMVFLTRFLEDNAPKLPFIKDHANPKEMLAAHLMGRWKNGTCQLRLYQINVYLFTD